jgi:hypothetical protein
MGTTSVSGARNLQRVPLLAYIEAMNILISVLKAGHTFVPVLIATAQRFSVQIGKLAL